jgi:hypothetical protein
MVYSLWFAVEYKNLWLALCCSLCLLYQVGRLVLDKEKFRQQFRNDYELTEVDIDNLEPLDDSDVSRARPSNSKVVQPELSIAVDPELGLDMEGDIADERIYDWVDDASLSGRAPTIMPSETGNGSECSGSRKSSHSFYDTTWLCLQCTLICISSSFQLMLSYHLCSVERQFRATFLMLQLV